LNQLLVKFQKFFLIWQNASKRWKKCSNTWIVRGKTMPSIIYYYIGPKIGLGYFISRNFGIGQRILRKLHDRYYYRRLRMYVVIRGRQCHDGIFYHVHLSNWKRYLSRSWSHLRFYVFMRLAIDLRNFDASFVELRIEDYGIIRMGGSMHRNWHSYIFGHRSFILPSNYVANSLWKIVICLLEDFFRWPPLFFYKRYTAFGYDKLIFCLNFYVYYAAAQFL